MTENVPNILYGDSVDIYKIFTCPECNKNTEISQEVIFNAVCGNNRKFGVACLHCGNIQQFNMDSGFDLSRYHNLPYRISRKD